MPVYNFSSGPATLPESVLRTAQQEMLDYNGTGISVMTMSHRSDAFLSILHHAEQDLRDLFFRLPQIKRQDPAAAKIIRLFARSVWRFAEKRYPKRFGGG